MRDCGKPIGDTLFDIDEVAFMFEYYAVGNQDQRRNITSQPEHNQPDCQGTSPRVQV